MKTARTTGSGQVLLGGLLACLAGLTHAEQYRSEVREVAPPAQQTQSVDPAKLLQQTQDPYERALLLRDMAAQAVQKKNFKQAQDLLEQALAQKAFSGPAMQKMQQDLAAIAMATGELKDQVPRLESLVKSGNATPEVRAALGAAYLQNKRYADAVPQLERAIDASKSVDTSWRKALVSAYIGAGQHAKAAVLQQALLDGEPRDASGWLRLAALYLKAKNSDRAQATMEVANRLGYLESTEDRLRLVSLTAQVGAPFEAGSLLQRWREAKRIPDSVPNQRLQANLWLAAREPALALKPLQALAARQPSREVFEQIARARLELEAYAEAALALEQALQIGGKDGPLLLSLALARYQQADVDAALAAFRDAEQFEAQSKLAGQWIQYLESGRAREQALAAAARDARQQADVVVASERFAGDPLRLSEAEAVDRQPADPTDLTPIGALRQGNAAGTIPDWNGGLSKSQWPAGFSPGQALLDPYPQDEPLDVITAETLERYRTVLSDGHQALLRRYPGYRMPLYTTRRSVRYPDAIQDASRANKGRAKLLGSDALTGARLGFPFPEPRSGVEAMWNHRVRFRGNSTEMQSVQVVMDDGDENGRVQLQETALFRYANTEDPVDLSKDNYLLFYLLRYQGVGLANFVALVHETANTNEGARNIWVAPPRSPKLFRVPAVGYDNPFPGTDGLYFVDMVDMYNGAFDRYVWKLIGRREMIVPYNSYRLSDPKRRYSDLLGDRYLNPEHARYELHRVWVVEATERGEKRHSFGLRRFYIDEDSWNIVMVENHDRSGKLWRFQEGHLLPRYDVMAANCAPVVTYDLKDGRYLINRLTAEEPAARFGIDLERKNFLPAFVQQNYVR